MADITWPALLPLVPEQEGYGEKWPDNKVRTSVDVGPPKVRKRSTAGVKELNCVYYLTPDQVTILETFYQDTSGYGSIPFDWNHPRTGAPITVRFKDQPKISPVGGNEWRAELTVEVIP